jgi:hypothetical protein
MTCVGEKSTDAGKAIVPSASSVTRCTAVVPLALASFCDFDAFHAWAWFESDASVTVNHTVREPERPL